MKDEGPAGNYWQPPATVKLRPVTGQGNRYCAPAVLSCVLGIPVREAAARLRFVGGERSIRLTQILFLLEALFGSGVHCEPVQVGNGPTLARFLRERSPEIRASLLLVQTTGHVIAVQGDKAVDNCHRTPTSTEKYRHRRARVVRCWALEKE